MQKAIILFTILVMSQINSLYAQEQKLPKGFVYLGKKVPSIQSELRYLSNNNFIGKPIDGYQDNKVIISKPAADALQKIQEQLATKHHGLKIFDAYRPQQAVDHFVRWAGLLNDTLMKAYFYPSVAKSALFKKGYIASKSSHTRGSTVDLTLVDLRTGKELDMGSPYDFFGIQSHPYYPKLTKKQQRNRMLLRTVMLSHGFAPYENEWWHFTLKEEPFPSTYFNFPVQ